MSQSRDHGFTMIEVLVTIGLASVLMAFAVAGYHRWAVASEQSGTARELQSLLRNTQQRAVTEGTAMCVQFDTAADTYRVVEGTCADPGDQLQGPFPTADDRIELASPAFASGSQGVTFFARGTASAGSVQVVREGSSKVYTIDVEGLTGRVDLR